MTRFVRHTRLSQASLFRPPPRGPRFQTLPRDIQDKTIRLLARLLRREVEQRRTGRRGRRAMSEKIKPQHVARKAMLYVRQSSGYQVTHNLESQRFP